MAAGATQSQTDAFRKTIPAACTLLRSRVDAKLRTFQPPPDSPYRPAPTVSNLASPTCGARVLAVTDAPDMPISGVNAIFKNGNSDCIGAEYGQGLEIELQLCPQAAAGVSRITIGRSSMHNSGKGFKSRPSVLVLAAGRGRSYKPIGGDKNFGAVTINTGAPIEGIERLRIEIPGSPQYKELLCSIDVR